MLLQVLMCEADHECAGFFIVIEVGVLTVIMVGQGAGWLAHQNECQVYERNGPSE